MELRLRNILKRRGITLKAFANQVGVAVTSLPLEEGRSVTLANLEKYAEILNIPAWELLYEMKPEKESEKKGLKDKATISCPKCGAKLSVSLKITVAKDSPKSNEPESLDTLFN